MGAELVHFDIPAEDPEKLAGFYRQALGWNIELIDPNFPDYFMVRTGEGEDSPGGGIGKKGVPDQRPVNYYGVDDLEEGNTRVREAGGQVLMERMPVPGWGALSNCLDPEGNPFGLWEEERK